MWGGEVYRCSGGGRGEEVATWLMDREWWLRREAFGIFGWSDGECGLYWRS